MNNTTQRRIAVIGMTSNKGGIESVIMNIYRNIDRTKVQFDFLISYNSVNIAYEEEILSFGGRIFKILYPQKKYPYRAGKELKKYFKENPDVKGIHLHTNFPYAFPLKIAKNVGVETRIIHAHSSALLFCKEEGVIGTIKNIRNQIVYRQTKKYPNIFFSCSDLAAKSTFKKEDFVWIKNGINLNVYKYNEKIREQIRKEYKIKENDVVIGCVGRLCMDKKSLFVLEIFNEYQKKNCDAKLVFLGNGELKDVILKRAEEYGISGKVLMLGMITDTSKWYQAFDFVLMPSRFEGFPVVLVEAQASGNPCLVSDTITKQSKLTPLVEYKNNNLSATDWAEKMEEMLQNKYDRNIYSEILLQQGFEECEMAKQVMKYYLGTKE